MPGGIRSPDIQRRDLYAVLMSTTAVRSADLATSAEVNSGRFVEGVHPVLDEA